MSAQNFSIQYIKSGELKPAQYNPRKIDEKELQKLRNSIKEFGMVDPVIVNKDMTIIGGHQRLKAAVAEGIESVPCVVLDIDKQKEKVLNLALNKISGQWDNENLAVLLKTLEQEERQLAGFDKDEISKVLSRYMNPEEDEHDDTPPAVPTAKLGDVYQLGRHRLMCGDSTNIDNVATLMDGDKADMVFTDPPYNVNYAGMGKKTSRTIENDHMDNSSFLQFLDGAYKSMAFATTENAPAYVCYASSTHREFENSLNNQGYRVKNQIIWVKKVASMGWGDYRWKHEPILYCVKQDQSVPFYGERNEYTVWDHEPTDEELLSEVKRQVSVDEDGASTVWRLGRDSNYEHPTQKPVKLVAIALMNSSQIGDKVLDLFGGGGYNACRV